MREKDVKNSRKFRCEYEIGHEFVLSLDKLNR